MLRLRRRMPDEEMAVGDITVLDKLLRTSDELTFERPYLDTITKAAPVSRILDLPAERRDDIYDIAYGSCHLRYPFNAEPVGTDELE